MKKVLFVIPTLTTGGAEKSLVNLLNLFDYSTYRVDLLLFKQEGIFIKQVPKEVNILPIPNTLKYAFKALDADGMKQLSSLNSNIRRYLGVFLTRVKYKSNRNLGSQIRWNLLFKQAIKELPGDYDVAISYMHGEAMYYVADKVHAKKKMIWVHNDYNAEGFNKELDRPYVAKFDKIVSISDECVNIFCDSFPDAAARTVYIPNLTSSSLIKQMAREFQPVEYVEARRSDPDKVILLSIGRLVTQKGFDVAIQAAKVMQDQNINFIWYIIGQGELREKLQKQIIEAHVEQRFILLGIRENPYPYYYHCNIFVQPSRYEGKSVALDEAKILAKPIIVSNYDTVKDQIIEDAEGIIVPLEPDQIAQAVINLINDPRKSKQLSEYLIKHEYGNEELIEMYYRHIG
ncbi:glycosyltransferase [Paenibacillus sp. CF384]|uniref:glycosyltransferase n=1 Tax=Paenibacillus sp. CF384 TaxID=1884382 RepID=UPI00089512AE|nr:glycosyltransferase [Paenibacillus sp. CF384]SDX65681.1 Glycosyltransferase involved in cell wall bisynthesis [Paenibacillus sp. CF384]